MWDVVEHLSDPLTTLREAHRVLEGGGAVLVMTIDIDSLMARAASLTSKTKDFLYDIYHCCFLSQGSFTGCSDEPGSGTRGP